MLEVFNKGSLYVHELKSIALIRQKKKNFDVNLDLNGVVVQQIKIHSIDF